MISKEREEQLNKFLKSVNLECDLELLNIAFTHSSYCNENNLSFEFCNERMEFLGDAVLKLVISDCLFTWFPQYHEGDMSFIRGMVVSDEVLSKVAKKINMQDYLLLGKGEEKSGGRNNNTTIACAFEAFLAALYLSSQLKQIIFFLEKLFEQEIHYVNQEGLKVSPKAMLQEYLQSFSTDLPEYVLTKEAGPPNNRTFYVDVVLKNEIMASGKGTTKKAAQKEAALNACKKLGLIKEKGENNG